MKWEAVILIAYLGLNLAAYSMDFLKKMDLAVTPDQRSIHRMALVITMAYMGVLIACVLRLAR
jgi:hypothetical protein